MTDEWNGPRRAPAAALTRSEIDQRVFDLYDECCHGRLDRRGFHDDSTPRYHEASAEPAWERTIAFFKKHLA